TASPADRRVRLPVRCVVWPRQRTAARASCQYPTDSPSSARIRSSALAARRHPASTCLLWWPGRLSCDDLWGVFDHQIADRLTFNGRDQHLDGHLAHLEVGHPDRRQWRIEIAGELVVVESND